MTLHEAEEAAIPQYILKALERLETARTPSDLGPAYGIVLHWKAPRSKRRLGPFRPFDLLVATFWPMAILSKQSEWVQGFSCAVAAFGIARFLDSLLGPLFARPNAIQARTRAALDKWRHLVPVMREPPK